MPSPPRADEGGERRARDHLDGGGADAGDDHRHRQRELDAPQDLPPRHAHPVRRLADGRVDIAEGGIGIDENRRQREDCQGEDGGFEREPEIRQREEENGEAGDDAQRVEAIDDRRRCDARARREDAERHADGDADAKRDADEQ